MKRITLVLTVFFLLQTAGLSAQQKTEAVKYLEEMTASSSAISSDMLAYIQAIAHTKDKRNIHNKRIKLISTVERAILSVNQAGDFQGDDTFQEATLKFLNTMYSVLREDYARLVDMEKVAEESFDLMEAYLNAREQANEKLKEASDELMEAQKEFAEDNNIRLIDEADETGKKLIKAGKVMSYQSDIFLIYFKSYKQEMYVLDALNRKDVNSFEQNREKLADYAEDGLDELEDIEILFGDPSLKEAARKTLEFYQKEAEDHFLVVTDFILKEEQFQKAKKALDQIPQNERTQEDIDRYNKMVDEYNRAGQKFNQINAALNQQRGQLVDYWNRTNDQFLKRHVPR